MGASLRLSVDVEAGWGDLALLRSSQKFAARVGQGNSRLSYLVNTLEAADICYVLGITGASLLRDTAEFREYIREFDLQVEPAFLAQVASVDRNLLFPGRSFLEHVKRGVLGIHGFTHRTADLLTDREASNDYRAAICVLERSVGRVASPINFIPPRNVKPAEAVLRELKMVSRASPSLAGINYSDRRVAGRLSRLFSDAVWPLFREGNSIIFALRFAWPKPLFRNQLRLLGRTVTRLDEGAVCDLYFHPHDLGDDVGLVNYLEFLQFVDSGKLKTLGSFRAGTLHKASTP